MFYKQPVKIGNDERAVFFCTVLLIFNSVFTEILCFEEKGMSFCYIQLLFIKLCLQISKPPLFLQNKALPQQSATALPKY